MHKYDIHVSYTKGTSKMCEYHMTAWGSEDQAKAIATADSIFAAVEKDGSPRFRGVNVCDPGGEVIYRLRRDDG
jgi:hypothetical protein